jgi:hypothetical protein
MKIEHFRTDPETGASLTIIEGLGADKLRQGDCLRGAGYRFLVDRVVQTFPEAARPTTVVLLSGFDRPRLGLVVHLEEEPLTAEELQAAVRHLLMVPRMIKGIDYRKADEAIGGSVEAGTSDAARTVRSIARALQRMAPDLPSDAELEHADRYVETLLRALA